jgi:hypothetical protein
MPQARPHTKKSQKRIIARKEARRKGTGKSIGIPPKGSNKKPGLHRAAVAV